MGRRLRILADEHCHHVTVRCNNRDFLLHRSQCRDVLLGAVFRAKARYHFDVYGVCVMSNHVHYLIAPKVASELPKIMQAINWYSAMCMNRILKRKGHFWEARYGSSSFPVSDHRRVLNTLRYIHANPKDAKMRRGFIYQWSNYRAFSDLADDGLTTWPAAYLAMAPTLSGCARGYRSFCRKYVKQPKPVRRPGWGSKLLPAGLGPARKPNTATRRSSPRTPTPGQYEIFTELLQGNVLQGKVPGTFPISPATSDTWPALRPPGVFEFTTANNWPQANSGQGPATGFKHPT